MLRRNNVARTWPNEYNIMQHQKCWPKNLTIFKLQPIQHNTQHAATYCNRVCNMLYPAMLRYVALKCCDRLAGACYVALNCWQVFTTLSNNFINLFRWNVARVWPPWRGLYYKYKLLYGILRILNFDWLTGRGIWVHIYTIDHQYFRGVRLFRDYCRRFWDISCDVSNKTVIALALVGYDIVIAHPYPIRAHGIIINSYV